MIFHEIQIVMSRYAYASAEMSGNTLYMLVIFEISDYRIFFKSFCLKNEIRRIKFRPHFSPNENLSVKTFKLTLFDVIVSV